MIFVLCKNGSKGQWKCLLAFGVHRMKKNENKTKQNKNMIMEREERGRLEISRVTCYTCNSPAWSILCVWKISATVTPEQFHRMSVNCFLHCSKASSTPSRAESPIAGEAEHLLFLFPFNHEQKLKASEVIARGFLQGNITTFQPWWNEISSDIKTVFSRVKTLIAQGHSLTTVRRHVRFVLDRATSRLLSA